VLLVLVAIAACVRAQSDLKIPRANTAGFPRRGRTADVAAVGNSINEAARHKFRQPADTDAVVDSEYIVTFASDTPRSTVNKAARQLKASNPAVELRLLGNQAQGWKGLAFKVPPQTPEQTAALMDSLLLLPEVEAGEATTVYTIVRPAPDNTAASSSTLSGGAAAPASHVKKPPRPGGPGWAPPSPPVDCSVIGPYPPDNVTDAEAPSWGLDRIDTRAQTYSKTYDFGSDGQDANVFIVDTGVQADHPELAGRVMLKADGGFDAYGGDGSDEHGHGTHCAGIVGGAAVGVAKGVKIYSVRVLDKEGSGTDPDVIAGINHVINSNVPNRIISMSLGGTKSNAINKAVASATAAGVLVVVAAGNEKADACISSPASAPSAITVGATDSTDVQADFSNNGPCVDIWAPGVKIYSSIIGGAYDTWSGTSMATPHVAGVAARFWSKGVCTSSKTCGDALKCMATPGVVRGNLNRSPNLLLYIPPDV